MKRAVFTLIFAVAWPLMAQAEIIDRIAAVVDGRIITASDVRLERAVKTVFGETTESDRALLQDLIDRVLVEEQITQFPELAVSDEDLQAALRGLQLRPGMTDKELEEAVGRRILRARFFEVRFRQFIAVTDEEIRKYYEEVFLPEARSRGLQSIPSLEQATPTIRDNVIDEKLTQEVELWLDTIRRRSNIEIFE